MRNSIGFGTIEIGFKIPTKKNKEKKDSGLKKNKHIGAT